MSPKVVEMDVKPHVPQVPPNNDLRHRNTHEQEVDGPPEVHHVVPQRVELVVIPKYIIIWQILVEFFNLFSNVIFQCFVNFGDLLFDPLQFGLVPQPLLIFFLPLLPFCNLSEHFLVRPLCFSTFLYLLSFLGFEIYLLLELRYFPVNSSDLMVISL